MKYNNITTKKHIDGMRIESVRIYRKDDEEMNSEDPRDRDEGITPERIKAHEDGEWSYIGIRAECVVSYPLDEQGNRRLQEFSSGGLWGIESDSDEKYLKEVEQEELTDLVNHLKQFGIKTTVKKLNEMIEG